MTRRPRPLLGQSTVDAGVTDAMDGATGDCLAVARHTVEEAPSDRWYGRLVAAAHDAVAGPPRTDAVLPAAVSVELLRGYCRLRGSLLAGLSGSGSALGNADQSAALLAGDYLHAMAFLELQSVPRAVPAAGFETLTDALESVRAGFNSAFAGPGATATSPVTLVEQTAGSVADAAVRLGVSLGDADHPCADELAAAARDFATARGLRQLRDAAHLPTLDLSLPDEDGATLRQRADSRRADGNRRLRGLPGDVDGRRVRRLARAGGRPTETRDAGR